MGERRNLIIGGVVVGAIAVALVLLGNPANMGFCVACFLRDTVGALGFHNADAVKYVRPELIGLALGACIMALSRREFSARGGSSPFQRFVLGFCVMIGALVFLGCPFRMILRLAAGDLNALVGFFGFAVGIGAGVLFLKRGFSLGKSHKQPVLEGAAFSIVQLALLGLLIFGASWLTFSESGVGSAHAPIWASLIAGIAVGAIAQRTRLCMAGGVRDVLLFKDVTLLLGFVALFVTVLVANIALGSFNLSFEGQPVAHTESLWNFLGLFAVGLGSVLLGGCPLRQLVLAGEGNSDSAITIIGLAAGAAAAHNLGLASSGDGTTENGRIALVCCIIVTLVIAVFNTFIIKGVSK